MCPTFGVQFNLSDDLSEDFFAKPRNLNVSLRLTALSLTLSHGERGQIG